MAANNILRFSATIDLCPSIKIIKRYNKIPITTECNNIIRPFSMVYIIYYIKNLYPKVVWFFAPPFSKGGFAQLFLKVAFQRWFCLLC